MPALLELRTRFTILAGAIRKCVTFEYKDRETLSITYTCGMVRTAYLQLKTKPFILSVTMTVENDLLESAFRLAYAILGERHSAELSAVAAIARLRVAAVAQDRRYYYVPGVSAKAYGMRTKVSMGELHLLQRLVYDETESYERAQEVNPAISEERLLAHFIKHLVRITMKRNSFYVTLGISRLLYHYTTPEAAEIYGAVVQNPSRVKDNYYWRSRKAQLMQEVKTRFGNLITFSRGAYGEERFTARDDSPRYATFVKSYLNALMPWNTACPLPPGTEATAGSIPSLNFRGQDPDEEHRIEIARIHAVLHSNCFSRLVAGLKLDAPDERLVLPQFFLSQNRGQNKPMFSQSLPPEEMSRPDVTSMRAQLDKRERLLRRANPQFLHLYIDRQDRGTLDLSASEQASFTLAEGEEFIELRTPPEQGDISLGLYPIDYARLEQTRDSDEFTLALADGRKLNFAITPQRDEHGELRGATVRVRPQPTSWQLWKQRLGAVFTPSTPAFSYAVGAALMLAGLTFGAALWKLLRTDSPAPTIAINKPAVPDSSVGGGVMIQPTPAPALTKPPRPQGDSSGKIPPDVKRESDPNVAVSIKTLAEVQRIFISLNGDSLSSQVWQEKLHQQLNATRRWKVAPQEDADAALNVVIRSGGHTASFQLVNASGQIIWPSKGKWRTYSGTTEQVVTQLVNELLSAAQ